MNQSPKDAIFQEFQECAQLVAEAMLPETARKLEMLLNITWDTAWDESLESAALSCKADSLGKISAEALRLLKSK